MSACVIAEPQPHLNRPARVSVLMLTYNRPQFIGRAIQSVIDQDWPEWELIVVHDGADERIADLMRNWEAADRRIRYLRRPQGGNIANATNYGIAHAKGDYIAILDDDDYWISKQKLTRQVRFLDENPDYAACGGGMIVIDESGREKLRCLKRQHDGDLKRWALVANPIAHSTAMFRRSLIERCGRYDESLDGFQDWDVFLKLGQHGKLYNFREAFLCYTLWSGGGSFARHRSNTRSALTIVHRHGRAYRGFLPAIVLAGLHFGYAHLPAALRRLSFSFLSRAKKAFFSERPKESREAAEEIVYEATSAR